MLVSVNNFKCIIWWGLLKFFCLWLKVILLIINKKIRYMFWMIDKGLNVGREWSWLMIVRLINNRMIKWVMIN